jgi:thiol-disulfide isomerase/thioredoxin
MTCPYLFGVALLAMLPVGAQQCVSDYDGSYSDAPADVQAAIFAAMGPAPRQSGDERVAGAKKVREQLPSDYSAHRFYQYTSYYSKGYRGFFSSALQEEYRKLLDAHPESLMYLMMYARTLVGSNTPEAVRLFDKILTREPNYQPPRLKLLEIYSTPAFRDNAKLVANADAFWKVCPDSLSPYAYIKGVSDAAFNARAAARLRKLLEGRTDYEALGLYGTLWSMEFKTVPLSEQEPVRERVRKDAEFLKSVHVSMDRSNVAVSTLGRAYELLGDAQGKSWAQAENDKVLDRLHSSVASSEAIRQWHAANPSKTGLELEAYQEKLLQQTEEWIHKWPDDPEPRSERFQVLRAMRDAPLEDAVSAAEDWIRTHERQPVHAFNDNTPPFNPPYEQVAQYFAAHNIRFAELPDLLEKAVKETQRWLVAPVSDLYPANSQLAERLVRLSTLNSLAGSFLKIKKYARARELLTQVGPELLPQKPPESANESEKRGYASIEHPYWSNMSTLALAEGNKLDYLTYERNAILADSTHSPAPPQQDLIDNLRNSWKEVKGSDEGFESWFGKPKANVTAAALDGWTKIDKPMPDFRISAADGKTWQLADLKGKVTLVNVWATWCGPCREELPYLQKLFNKVRERKDLLVITLNADENPGMIVPFLKENKYTFPVLPASDYVSKLALTLPSNWIVDAKGVLRMERVGFSNGSDQWVADTIAGMEKAR